jgi:hypothetical protein
MSKHEHTAHNLASNSPVNFPTSSAAGAPPGYKIFEKRHVAKLTALGLAKVQPN